MFVLLLYDPLSLYWSPSFNTIMFYYVILMPKTSIEGHIKSTNVHADVKLEWGLYDKYWWSWKLLAFEVSCMGLLPDRGNSRYDKQSSCRRFETWWRSCGFIVMKWIYCRYGWFTQSSVWDNPCICICHPYGITRLYLCHYSDVIWATSRLI